MLTNAQAGERLEEVNTLWLKWAVWIQEPSSDKKCSSIDDDGYDECVEICELLEEQAQLRREWFGGTDYWEHSTMLVTLPSQE